MDAPIPPSIPLQLAARQKPLAASQEADFYAPDTDPADEDDSETSSMVVLARTKKKHKPYSGSSSESASREEQQIDTALNVNKAIDTRDDAVPEGDDMMDIEVEDDQKPPARPLPPRPDDNDAQGPPQEPESNQGNASSSSFSDQRIELPPPVGVHQGRHNYDGAHLITESSNANTSGSGGNSGSNQGSSGSGNGSSGNEGKGSSEDVGAKEGVGGDGNSNSDDVNSDERALDNDKEAVPVAASRRHVSGAAVEDEATLPVNLDRTSPKTMNEQNEAEREMKLQNKKRKRMDMRREYEEKVQEDLESSESSATNGVVSLRPGRPITLDKVLSFTKIPR